MHCTIEYACISDQGLVRSINQDNFYCFNTCSPRACERTNGVLTGQEDTDSGALFSVFDGMGGEQAGEDASYIAATTAADFPMESGDGALRRFCLEANKRIVTFTVENGLEFCGSTAAMLYFNAGNVDVCNLGDSRIYQVQRRELLQLSRDQVIPVPGRRKPALVQFLGMPDPENPPAPHLLSLPLRRGDCFLICSDGLTDMVDETQIAAIIAKHASLKDAAQALLDAALACGGRDNTTIILVRVAAVHRQWQDFLPFTKRPCSRE